MNRWESSPLRGNNKRYLVLPLPGKLPRSIKNVSFILVLVFGTNFLSHTLFNPLMESEDIAIESVEETETLYLLDKARLFIEDTQGFEKKVREIADMLSIQPEWLMAVMYAESQFDASVLNHKGSGATGLIQFMPATASEMNVSTERLKRMQPIQQLEYVYLYLQTVRERYGEFNTLTDLYLGILFPKAIGQDFCYTLYAYPQKSFQQNSGLDENKDHRVTISDIDRRMRRLFPSAYAIRKEL